jgi:hypothetical protein
MKILLVLLILAPLTAPAADPVDLFPDESLKGWTRVPIPPTLGVDPRMQWRVDTQAREVICLGNGGHEWLRFDKELADYDLHVEWRFTPKEGNPRYNSGIGIRLSKLGEIWHQAQTGPSGGWLFGETLVDGGIVRINLSKQMKENRVKPAGEWNVYDIHVEGPRIALSVNGAVVSEMNDIALRKGYIGLEGEGFEIRFRNIRLKEIR